MNGLMKIKEYCWGALRRIRDRLSFWYLRKRQGTGKAVVGWLLVRVRRAAPASWRFFLCRAGELRRQPAWLIVVVLTAAGFWLWLGPRAGVLWFVFLVFLVYEWDDRAVGVAALLTLTSCPILLALKRDAWAETAAVWAYFLLAMTVGLQIVEYKRHPERFKES